MNLLEGLTFRGAAMSAELSGAVTSTSVELSITQVSQIQLNFSDPRFQYLQSGAFWLGAPANFYGYELIASVIETTKSQDEGGFSVTFRPAVINRLRSLTGALSTANISPSQYVQMECARAGVAIGYLQASPRRPTGVSRDVAQPNEQYDPWTYPSAWTTFNRLAPELGFTVFERQGAIFFGQPTRIANFLPSAPVTWYTDDGYEPIDFPQCRQSLESLDTDITLTVPIHRRNVMIPGNRLLLTGLPQFSGQYLITEVQYPLELEGTITVTASTLRDPLPTGDPDAAS